MSAVIRRMFLFIVVPMLITHAAYSVVGCASALKALDEYDSPQDGADLKRCRNAGRAELDAGSSKYRAYDVYEACTREAGLR